MTLHITPLFGVPMLHSKLNTIIEEFQISPQAAIELELLFQELSTGHNGLPDQQTQIISTMEEEETIIAPQNFQNKTISKVWRDEHV